MTDTPPRVDLIRLSQTEGTITFEAVSLCQIRLPVFLREGNVDITHQHLFSLWDIPQRDDVHLSRSGGEHDGAVGQARVIEQ